MLARVGRSTWALGLLVALASWNVALASPFPGLDESWHAALYMAAARGLHFGSQIVFTYGPLGFLGQAWLWSSGLAVVAWLFTAALYLATAISVVWALRRSLGALVAALVATLLMIATPQADIPLALATVWCLAALAPGTPVLAGRLVTFGGAILGATECLVVLRTGPVILVAAALTLAARPDRRRRLPSFAGLAALTLTVLWFASGQTVSNLPDYVRNGAQVVSGYSEAMGTVSFSPLVLPGALLVVASLVAVAVITSSGRRARIGAAAVTAFVGFALYKEATVRADHAHAAVLFSTAAVIAAGLAFGKRRLLAAGTLAAVAALAVLTVPGKAPLKLDPLDHVRAAADQARTVLSPKRRQRRIFAGLLGLALNYRLSAAVLSELTGRTVLVDPWEVAVASAYRLRWQPLPVIQEYSAYTATLDHLNADALRAPGGPERILRENTALVDDAHGPPAIDGRIPAWDPPEKSLAMLCNYVTLRTEARWQVLGKTANRCGAPERAGTLTAQEGRTIVIPPAKPGGVLYARIHGAGVSGLERVRALLYRARLRYVVVNGGAPKRLVPGTAGDGLILDSAPGVDYPAPFGLSPSVRTLRFRGTPGAVRLDLFWMRVSSTHP
jgi:hypothetical protein